MFIAVYESGRRRQNVENAVHERRPQVLPLPRDNARILHPFRRMHPRQEPERQHLDLGIFCKYALEHLRTASADESAQLVIRQFSRNTEKLPYLRIVLQIHVDSDTPTITRDAGGNPHIFCQPRPCGVISPRLTHPRRTHGDEKILLERIVSGHLAEFWDHRRKRLICPVLIVNRPHPDETPRLVASAKPYKHAVQTGRAKLLRMRQKIIDRCIVEPPATADNLLLRCLRTGHCQRERRRKK